MGKLIINGLIHASIAVFMQCLIGLGTGNWWAGAAFGIGFYWGREKRDYELHSKDILWYHGWIPFEWDTDGQNDFWWPFAACMIVGSVAHY